MFDDTDVCSAGNKLAAAQQQAGEAGSATAAAAEAC